MRKHLFLLSTTVIAVNLLCADLYAGAEPKTRVLEGETPSLGTLDARIAAAEATEAATSAPAAAAEEYPSFPPPSYADTMALKAQEEADALMAKQLQEAEEAAAARAAAPPAPAAAGPEPAAALHPEMLRKIDEKARRFLEKSPEAKAESTAKFNEQLHATIGQLVGARAAAPAAPAAAPQAVVQLPVGVAMGTIVNEKLRRRLADEYGGGHCKRTEEEEDNPGARPGFLARRIPAIRCSFNWFSIQPRKQLTETGWKNIAPIETFMEGDNAGLHTHFLDGRTLDRWKFKDPSAPGGWLIKKGPFPESD